MDNEVNKISQQLSKLTSVSNDTYLGIGEILGGIGELSKLACHAFINAMAFNLVSHEDLALEDIRHEIYKRFKT
jgi:hypothetical protein